MKESRHYKAVNPQNTDEYIEITAQNYERAKAQMEFIGNDWVVYCVDEEESHAQRVIKMFAQADIAVAEDVGDEQVGDVQVLYDEESDELDAIYIGDEPIIDLSNIEKVEIISRFGMVKFGDILFTLYSQVVIEEEVN